MASISIFQETKELETEVGRILSAYDLADMPREQGNLVTSLKHLLIDARLDARDYEYAQTRADQLQTATEGRQRLGQAQAAIVKISEYGLFGAVDVAQLSATIQHIMSRMD
ncbi:MAG TPA: hypothetical protein VD735_07165 [Candidatus Saccharimonadales bacterium]|nr:hypothetical protein [Candidatus Saccharimonadales bacterium]